MEGGINELVHGHGMRRCRYRGQQRAHLQHVFTAIAANIECLSRRSEKYPRSGRRPPCKTSWTSTGSPGRGLGGPPETEQTTPRSPTESSSRVCPA
ncbi:transposase [Streptomyces sp. NPDC001698]|uniref:transposase n=1 Tax=Streptomyces sp. NPDC001698 TaxID=3364601 RepID=UPI00367E5E23